VTPKSATGGIHRLLPALLLSHAVITAAAGVVLVAAPAAIPAAAGIMLPAPAYLLSYLLAAAEFAFAFLSFWGARTRHAPTLRAIVLAIIVLHAASALLELLAIAQGTAFVLGANVVVRVIVIALFVRAIPATGDQPSAVRAA